MDYAWHLRGIKTNFTLVCDQSCGERASNFISSLEIALKVHNITQLMSRFQLPDFRFNLKQWDSGMQSLYSRIYCWAMNTAHQRSNVMRIKWDKHTVYCTRQSRIQSPGKVCRRSYFRYWALKLSRYSKFQSVPSRQ